MLLHPDLLASGCRTWICLDISRFLEEQCQPCSGSAWPACTKTVNQAPIAGGRRDGHKLPDRGDSYTTCMLCLLDPCEHGVVVYPLQWLLLVEGFRSSRCGPPVSFSLHLASSSITPAGSVHKSRCVCGCGLKRWCVSWVGVLQRGHSDDRCDLARLCLSMIWGREIYLFWVWQGCNEWGGGGKYLSRAANAWWRCAQYSVIASCG